MTTLSASVLGEQDGTASVNRDRERSLSAEETTTLRAFVGATLAERALAPMRLADFLELAPRIAGALARLHDEGILHKNIAPRTISVDEELSSVAIIDLRFASYMPREQPHAAPPGGLEGALEYMAPEQTGRMNRRVDARADLYALGIVFFELLTGRLPFEAEDALGWVHAHIAIAPPSPSELTRQVPMVVSAIVLRLLMKDADDRYQTARGLEHDLARCRDALAREGVIEPFAICQNDLQGRLASPQRLYGRDRELAILLGVVDRIVEGGRLEVVIVGGYAGVGKSALIHELYKPVTRVRGLFVSGKFEQYNRGTPYYTLVVALRELTRQILTQPEPELAKVRARVLAALGINGKLITDVVPELALVIGEQPPIAELGPTEAQNRWKLVFLSFLRAVARLDLPIIVFLDDLQWADSSTLDLLAALAADTDLRSIGFVFAYRDNEIDAGHPLALTLEKLRRGSAKVHAIELAPLDLPSTAALVADTLRTVPSRARTLAHLVHRKTAGNPFFAGEFLKALSQEGLLSFDHEARAFRWDVDRIDAKAITDNVIDLLLERLERLPPRTRRALTLASCIGTSFRLTHLAEVTGEALRAVAQDLFPAMKDELITSVGAAYPRVVPREQEAASALYRFEHDRIQQAAYSRMDEGERRLTHLAIGRVLLAQSSDPERDDALFSIVNQLDQGRALIDDPAEELRLFALNVAAGQRAKAAAAYLPALGYLRAAKELEPAGAWEQSYRQQLEFTCDLVECEYIAGNAAEAMRLLDEALGRTTDLVDTGRINRIRLDIYQNGGRYAEGLAFGIAALRQFGVEIPETTAEINAAFGVELGRIREILGARRVADLLDGPPMQDATARTLIRLFGQLNTLAYIAKPELYPLFSAKSVIVAMQAGNGVVSARAYSPFGVLQVVAFDDLDAAYAYSTLAIELCERFDDVTARGVVLYGRGALIAPWREPFGVALGWLEAAIRASLDTGDLAMATIAWADLPLLRFARGDALAEVSAAAGQCAVNARRAGNPATSETMQTFKMLAEALLGRTASPVSLSQGALDEADLTVRAAQGQAFEAAMYHLVRMILTFMHERFEEAQSAAIAAAPVSHCFAGRIGSMLYQFYRALIFAALASGAEPAEQTACRAELDAARATFTRWALRGPENFRSRATLLDAEAARLDGRPFEALALYEASAKAARASGFTHDEALARELAGKLLAGAGQELGALAHLDAAARGYEAWGATRKAQALRKRYPALAPPAPLAGSAKAEDADLVERGAAVDLQAFIGAAQAISSEIDTERLIQRVMTVTLQSAAAERGALLRAHAEELTVIASAQSDKGEISVSLSGPDAPAPAWSPQPGVVQYVKRTRESVVLDDAARDARFTIDEQLAGTAPRSVLCAPLLRQGELMGVLYLENNLTAGAFTRERTLALEVLASQAAISLENASLYGELRRENAERRRAEEEVRSLNAHLERRVRARTVELEAANKELEAFGYTLSHDLQAPLRAIDGFSAALVEDYGASLDQGARGYLDHLRASSQRMRELIDDMLKLARIASSELEDDEVDLSALARDVIASIRAAEPSRAVVWTIPDGLRARGDLRLLKIVLENLLGNAFKFTSKRPRAHVELGAQRGSDGKIAYFVRDDGAGFDMARAAKLFGAFQRLHRASDFAGTGIGLATVQRIITRHGGRVWAEGAVGGGATFSFTLEVS